VSESKNILIFKKMAAKYLNLSLESLETIFISLHIPDTGPAGGCGHRGVSPGTVPPRIPKI
jgi:hypothetical protein